MDRRLELPRHRGGPDPLRKRRHLHVAHRPRFVPETGGTVHGKDVLRSYWTRALEENSDLHFELIDVYVGIDTIVLHYQNQLGGLVNEVLTFRDGLVATGHAAQLHR